MFTIKGKWGGLKKYSLIVLGSLLYAIGISMFLDPNNLAPGGVTGIAIIVNRILGIPTGTLIIIVNIPLMLVGVYKFGLKFFLSTIFAIGVSSAMIDLLAPFGAVTSDPLLAAVAGGVILAVGMGIIFRVGATTGGTDIVVRLIKLRYKHIKTGKLFLITDAVVVALSAVVFGEIDVAMYAAIAVVICSTVMDMVLYGADSAKLVFIITEKDVIIAQKIMDELELGVTYLKGEGAFTENKKRVIMCAMRKQNLPLVREIAMSEDPFAFMIVSSASEVFGEGFKDIGEEHL